MPRLLASTACVAACLAAVSLAQQAPSQPLPQFRTGVEVIEVDVSVLDRDRRPVRGLTAKDFTLLEEGRPQEIVSFTSIDVPEPEPVSTAWMRDIAPDVSANLAGADRLVVLVIDDAQVRIGPQHAQTTKSIARRVIDQLGPRDLAAVVFTRDNSGAQPFTSNRSRLLAAVDSFSPGFTGASGTGDFSIDYFYRSSMLTLKYVVESLADAGQRRKAVIYVSPGIPLEGNSLEVYSRRNDALQIFREAQRANVTFYGIDPSGLGGLDREDPIASGLASDLIRSPQSVLNDFLHSLASNTGGLAIVNRNEFASGVAQIFAENGSYYLLGYRAAQQSTAQKRDGQLRRIEVRVNRPGVTVRARTGYVGPRSEAPPKTGAPSGALVKALRDVTPRGDVAMQVMAAPFAVPGRKPAAVALVIALRQPKPPSTGPLTEQVDMIISATGRRASGAAASG
jgi:VWFA-related protein